DEVTRYEVSGSISLEGEPLPAGEIIFEPDTAQGNSGPAGIADIKEGKYTSRKGWGVVGGPHIAVITANNGGALPEDGVPPAGYQLLFEHSVPIDFTDDNFEQSIEVSKSDIKRR
ncbi:MAG: hypothetical protein DWQ29_23985, partial [Planctomycetota bacterium]